MITGRCVTKLRTVAQPALRLFLFHCAGGSHLLFRGWDAVLPADWDICCVEAPGRGRLADHPLASDAAALAAFVLPELAPLITGPCAFFGHSMGALVAYDLTLRLAIAGGPQPTWLGVSSRRAPDEPARDSALRHDVPDPELRRCVLEMGGTPRSVVDDPKMWTIMAPVLRADLRIGDEWVRPATPAFAPPPLSVFGANDDLFIPEAKLQGWRALTAHFVGMHLFSGGHFYFQRHLSALGRQIAADVAVARASAGVAAGF